MTANLDLHPDAIILYVNNNADNFSIIKIDNIVRLEKSLDYIVINSEMVGF